MRKILEVRSAPTGHWVGDGFPVRSLFFYGNDAQAISPFLLLDFAGPHTFAPATRARGVGQHPHRGFETVTIVYEGEVSHRDSTGQSGIIGPGDVQWMTAGGGILHEEFHSPAFTRSGGPFRMVQLWVNLPARDKMHTPRYQTILSSDIPVINLPGDAGRIRVIAGEFLSARGPASTFTPMNVWDVRLEEEGYVVLPLPDGHNAMLIVLSGKAVVNGIEEANEADLVRLDGRGGDLPVSSEKGATLLVLTGEPIDEPVVGYGPFVMNTEAEIREAMKDVQSGRFGSISASEFPGSA